MSNIYRVNFKRLALLLLPTFWRKPLIGALSYAVVSPICNMHVRFMSLRDKQSYRLAHNGQVCHLRAVLNDEFDTLERRITIGDITHHGSYMRIYKRELGRPTSLFKRYMASPLVINRRGFGGASGYDFVVNIPYELHSTIDTAQLRAVVNQYKLASKRFTTNYYNEGYR